MRLVEIQERSTPAEGVRSDGRLHVLSLSTVFPNRQQRDLGSFVRSRLLAVARSAHIKVVAPVPVLDYSNPRGEWLAGVSLPAIEHDGPLEVLHPRWLFPPFGTALNGPCMFLRLRGSLQRLRRTYRFHLIDAHFGFPEGVAAALLARSMDCPFIVTLRGNEPIFAENAARRRSISWALRQAARVICVSEELRRFALSTGVEPNRTTVIPNGVDTDLFYPRDRAAARARFGFSREARLIVSAGRLVEAKGHHYIVGALRRLIDSGIPAQLAIAGGPCREDRFESVLRGEIARLGLEDNVRLLGTVSQPDMPDLFSAADVFCLASFAEGWPNVVHEAQACGAPVVSTRVGGAPEMLPADEMGFLVPARDAGALEEALRLALARDWDRRAIADWGKSRSWRQVASEVIAEMHRALANAG
jgi:teichuronic acid biosynthesis glycosyltransferase TuaC